MIETIGTAILFGIVLSFSLGPVFFELINTSLKRGFKSALFLEIGVLISDVFYVFVALFSAEKIVSLISGSTYFKLIGGIIFMGFGIFSVLKNTLFHSPRKKRDPELQKIDDTILDKENVEEKNVEVTPYNIKAPRYIAQTLKGIMLNAVNPFVLVFWIGTCSITIKELSGTGITPVTYFIIVLSVMFGVDVTKIYFAGKLKKHMTPKRLKTIGIAIGVMMILAGVFIMNSKVEIPQM